MKPPPVKPGPHPRGPLSLFPRRTAKLLTREEEHVLAAKIKNGDLAAREALIVANLRLVVCIARPFRTSGLDLDDLIQEGNRGLMRAAQDFDPQTHGTRFSTYASHVIRSFIHKAIFRSDSFVKFPEYLLILRNQLELAMNDLRSQVPSLPDAESTGPNREQVAESLGISSRQLKNLRHTEIERTSFLLADEDGDVITLEESVVDPRPPDRDLEIAEELEQVHAAMQRLDRFEAWVVRRRFNLADHAGPTENQSYQSISDDCGLAIHHIRRIEQQALKKLRRFLDPDLSLADRADDCENAMRCDANATDRREGTCGNQRKKTRDRSRKEGTL